MPYSHRTHGAGNRSTVVRLLLLIGILLLMKLPAQGQESYRLNIPLVLKSSTVPKASTSYYVTQTTPLPLYQLKGCISAVELQKKEISNGFIAFFDGKPGYSINASTGEIEYGTITSDGKFLDLPFIKASMKLWIRGFMEGFHDSESPYDCSLRSDVKVPAPKVILSIVTTNEPLELFVPGTSPLALSNVSIEEHGYNWGRLIQELSTYVADQGWKNRIEIFGGNDIEIGFNTPAETKLWIKGYYRATVIRFYSLGDCAGCPNPLPWTLFDLWQVTSGVFAPIVPQIYRVDGAMAVQWSRADRIVRDTPDPRGDFPDSRLRLYVVGILTQHKACDDRGQRLGISGQEYCMLQGDNLYNTPQQAWNQMTDQYQAQNLGQPFSKATDVGYDWDYSGFRK